MFFALGCGADSCPEWDISGDTAIPADERPNLFFKLCLNNGCAASSVDTGPSLSDDAKTVDVMSVFPAHFTLSRAGSVPTWNYRVSVDPASMEDSHGRIDVTLEIVDEKTGALVLRARDPRVPSSDEEDCLSLGIDAHPASP